MSKKSDLRGGAADLAADQALRLRRLRALITHYQVDAAAAACVSQDAWSRMELGVTRIDVVALARFCIAYGLSAGYVVTGDLHGLSGDLLRLVALAEASGEEPPRVRRSRIYAPPNTQEKTSESTANINSARKRKTLIMKNERNYSELEVTNDCKIDK